MPSPRPICTQITMTGRAFIIIVAALPRLTGYIPSPASIATIDTIPTRMLTLMATIGLGTPIGTRPTDARGRRETDRRRLTRTSMATGTADANPPTHGLTRQAFSRTAMCSVTH